MVSERERLAAGTAAGERRGQGETSLGALLEPAAVMAVVAPELGFLMLGVTILSAVVGVIFALVNGPAFENLAGLIAFAVAGVAYVLQRSGRPFLAVRVMIWGLWGLLAIWGFIVAGLHTPVLFGFPFLLMLCGLLLLRREAVLMATATVLLLTLLAWGEFSGWLPGRVQRGPWAWWFSMAPMVVLGMLVTVSLRRRLEHHHGQVAVLTRQVVHLARHDPLTGLLNRSAMLEFLAAALSRAERGKHLVAVLFIDLDDFKRINDCHGHCAGDNVLSLVAERLRGAIRLSDAVARFGGDEFVVVLTDLADLEAVDLALQRVQASLKTPLALECGESVMARASIGLAVSPRDGMDVETLIRHADAGMYRIKAQLRPA